MYVTAKIYTVQGIFSDIASIVCSKKGGMLAYTVQGIVKTKGTWAVIQKYIIKHFQRNEQVIKDSECYRRVSTMTTGSIFKKL